MRRDVDRVWASGDLSDVFKGHAKVPCPWPKLGATRAHPSPVRLVKPELVDDQVRLVQVDPRGLWCTQSWVLLEHALYYTTGVWERTGVTSADRESAANRFPIVVRDHADRTVIVTGHHRSLVALVTGRPLLCRLLPDGHDDAVAMLPHLLVGERTSLPAVRCATVADAVATVVGGQIALVGSGEVARRVRGRLLEV